MSEKWNVINIRTYLDKNRPTYIGEECLYALLSEFSSPKNKEVENFLLHNAIEFTKKNQSVTYLVVNNKNDVILGYFSLEIKPISVRISNISRTMAKKLARVSILDKESESYMTAAYLIAQLGKNYALPKEKQITRSVLLESALEKVSELKYSIGGVMEFLECEENEFLLDFYTQNHFKCFDKRITEPLREEEPRQLYQLLKFI